MNNVILIELIVYCAYMLGYGYYSGDCLRHSDIYPAATDHGQTIRADAFKKDGKHARSGRHTRPGLKRF